MQFIANNEKEYKDVIFSIINANIVSEISMIYALNIEEDVIQLNPVEYPVLVSIDIEDTYQINSKYSYVNIKFIYINNILKAKDYINKLNELNELDATSAYLSDIIDTSGIINKPILEHEATNKRITEIEELLF